MSDQPPEEPYIPLSPATCPEGGPRHLPGSRGTASEPRGPSRTPDRTLPAERGGARAALIGGFKSSN